MSVIVSTVLVLFKTIGFIDWSLSNTTIYSDIRAVFFECYSSNILRKRE